MTLPSLSFGGLATPFDVNSLIDQIMAAESIPLQNLQTTRQAYQDKDSAWSSIVTKVSALRSSLDALEFDQFVTVSSSDESVVGVTATGNPNPGSVTFDVKKLAIAHVEHSDDTVSSATALLGSGDFEITVDGTDYETTLDGTQTIADLAAWINGLDVGVTASVVNSDTDEYKLVIIADQPGEESRFDVDSDISGFNDFDTAANGSNSEIQIGSGSNRLEIKQSSNIVSDFIPGVTLELKREEDDITVTTANDFAGSGAGVADLVAKLNSVLSELETLTSFDATTGTAGVLAGDSTARSLMTSLRNAISSSVGADPTTYTAPAVGISLERSGTFTIDQAAFEEALANDFDGVTAFMEDVLLTNLDDELDLAEGVTGSIARARDRWQTQIGFVDDRIADMENRLDRKEAALIRQFSALDTALQNLYAQQAWLTQQISAFGGVS